MCSHVSCVKVTWAPPCAAFNPAMHASTSTCLSFSLPIRTPQTSVFVLERACCRICRRTSVSIKTLGPCDITFSLRFIVRFHAQPPKHLCSIAGNQIADLPLLLPPREHVVQR